jgi:hypothetical protein
VTKQCSACHGPGECEVCEGTGRFGYPGIDPVDRSPSFCNTYQSAGAGRACRAYGKGAVPSERRTPQGGLVTA